VARSQIVAAF